MRYHHIHRIFKASLFIKGFYSIIQLISGVILLFVNSDAVSSFIKFIFKHELTEDPNDFVANYIIHIFNNFSPHIKLFIALYLIIHGIIKLGLVSSLWLKKIKAYPIAISIFVLFIIYQTYKYVISPSFIWIILSLLDILIIILTYIEYKHLKKYGTFES